MADHDTNGQAWRVPPSEYLRPGRQNSLPREAVVALCRNARWLPPRGRRLSAATARRTRTGDEVASGPDPHALLPALRAQGRAQAGIETSPNAAKYRDFFVPRGYALVVVDVRGTGASFGTRDSFRSPAEREDYREIAEWIVAQPWSDGVIGSTGISYLGAAALFLASTGHPGRQGGRAAVCGLEHLCRSLLSGRSAAEPPRGELRRADDRARSRTTRSPGKYAYFTRPKLRRAATRRRGCGRPLLREAVAEHLGTST